MTKEELVERAYFISGGSLADLTVAQLRDLMTVTQYVTDICLNEIEGRGELTFVGDMPLVPYQCDHTVETILTRR